MSGKFDKLANFIDNSVRQKTNIFLSSESSLLIGATMVLIRRQVWQRKTASARSMGMAVSLSSQSVILMTGATMVKYLPMSLGMYLGLSYMMIIFMIGILMASSSCGQQSAGIPMFGQMQRGNRSWSMTWAAWRTST
jgi:hypothetical protein